MYSRLENIIYRFISALAFLLLVLFVITLFSVPGPATAFEFVGDPVSAPDPTVKQKKGEEAETIVEPEPAIIPEPEPQAPDWENVDIDELNTKIRERKTQIDSLEDQIARYRNQITEKRKEAFTLKSQVDLLDHQIKKADAEIKKAETEITVLYFEIETTKSSVSEKQNEIEKKKKKVAEALRAIYRNDSQSYLLTLLASDSLSDFFLEARAIEGIHIALQTSLVELQDIKREYESSLSLLHDKKSRIEALHEAVQEEKARQESQQSAKNILLDLTRSSEAVYKELLAEARSEQESINADLVVIEKRLREELEKRSREEGLAYLVGEKLMWPVPKNKITAYFHDPDYPFRNVFEHPAIDIRASQGTDVRVAASGYVARVRRDPECAGRYAFIMVIHGEGLSTVYGHMSQIFVDEGNFVIQGQSIGKSGGLPGTCGAGRLTTGSHHHFEVRLNGIPVNPLNYLP